MLGLSGNNFVKFFVCFVISQWIFNGKFSKMHTWPSTASKRCFGLLLVVNKSTLVSELCFQVTALVCRAGHLLPRNAGCSQCVCDFTCAAAACVGADWMSALEAIARTGTWLRDHPSGVCTLDSVPLGRVKMSLAQSAAWSQPNF